MRRLAPRPPGGRQPRPHRSPPPRRWRPASRRSAAARPRAAILAPVERRIVPADSPYAPTVGYSRAVRAGNQIHAPGPAAGRPGGPPPPADAYGQARRCLEIILAALAEL